ncbi:H-NS family nucleoid-associated regulatory protein (plasmid) [Paraburkholderia sp. FT54]|uniref:H-NS family nucleoid-associated regulatory protein n=1 Tax=Paraburkholderia sp. FT54 TaxID=3074437 RepID=UPI0028775D5D|nr:H-NS family nucleoid-associated regulatory protein [Paraburkholderia sp. FT54]WNC95407.1 H-NS family nucleoid-associated regulatory protein [Paraburkholderia sp. FT54]
MDERKRDSMIAYLRHRMEDFGISADDLAATLAAEPAAGRYRSAHGENWSGEGAMPQWLKQPISAGQSIATSRCHQGEVSGSSSQASAVSGADCKNDPFAGRPLARSSSR